MKKPVYCFQCLYFQPLYLPNGHVRHEGECHRHAPVVAGDVVGVWPSVRRIDWCGEYETKAGE